MSKRRIILILLALLVIGIGIIKARTPSRPAPVIATKTETSALEFLSQELFTAAPVDVRQALQLSGSLRAFDLASVKARIAGDVREVLVREGEAVSAGQVIVKLDATEYAARVAQARGNLNSAQAQLDIALKARDNNAALVDKGFISKNAFDNSASQFAAAKANVDASQAALDIVQKSLNDTIIRAPIAGLVSVRSVQPGEKVSADNKLIDIVNLQKMEMEASVPASDVARVAIGQSVRLNIEGMSETFEGKVVRINPSTQAGSRSFSVYVQVANPGNQLRAGMFAEAQLTLNSKRGILALPQSAVRKDGSGTYVFTIENGKIARRPVTVGIDGLTGNEYRTEILSGLELGAQVIRTDMGNLTPGTLAHITQTVPK